MIRLTVHTLVVHGSGSESNRRKLYENALHIAKLSLSPEIGADAACPCSVNILDTFGTLPGVGVTAVGDTLNTHYPMIV